MHSETIDIKSNDSARLDSSGLILSVRELHGKLCDVVVGYPGLPNVAQRAATGDALLFETPNAGIFEVRVLTQDYNNATFLVTHVSPRLGFSAAFVTPHYADPITLTPLRDSIIFQSSPNTSQKDSVH